MYDTQQHPDNRNSYIEIKEEQIEETPQKPQRIVIQR